LLRCCLCRRLLNWWMLSALWQLAVAVRKPFSSTSSAAAIGRHFSVYPVIETVVWFGRENICLAQLICMTSLGYCQLKTLNVSFASWCWLAEVIVSWVYCNICFGVNAVIFMYSWQITWFIAHVTIAVFSFLFTCYLQKNCYEKFMHEIKKLFQL